MIVFDSPPPIVFPRPAIIQPDTGLRRWVDPQLAMLPGMFPGGAGSGTPRASTLTYLDKQLLATSASSYSFSGANIGAAFSGRYVILGFHAVKGSAATITAVTLNTLPMVELFAGTTTNGGYYIGVLRVDSGTTANFVVTLDGAAVGALFAVWTATELSSSLSPYDTGVSEASPPSVTLDIPLGGVAVAVAGISTTSFPGASWTGFTERVDGTAGIASLTAADYLDGGAGSSPTATVTFSGANPKFLAIASI